MSMNIKPNCNIKKCAKLERCAIELAARTMKLQACITEKLEESKKLRCKAQELRKKADCIDAKANELCREAKELSQRLERELKRANAFMIKAIECYRENNTINIYHCTDESKDDCDCFDFDDDCNWSKDDCNWQKDDCDCKNHYEWNDNCNECRDKNW